MKRITDGFVRRNGAWGMTSTGLTPTGVVLRATATGPVFVEEETGVSSDFDPRWNCQVGALWQFDPLSR